MGLGFSSKKKKISPPIVPNITININEEKLELPKTPVRSTNANGIVSYNLYETSYEIPKGTTKVPTVTASSDNKDVKVTINQADSMTGTAKVDFDYNGVVKTYQIVFEPQTEEMHVYLCLGQSNMEGMLDQVQRINLMLISNLCYYIDRLSLILEKKENGIMLLHL